MSSGLLRFVPLSRPPNFHDIEKLQSFVAEAKRMMVLTGAGLSTESGIPDYRSASVGLYARTSHRPLQYQEFVCSAAARQRYWARNFVGWSRFSTIQPNVSHMTFSEWEKKGVVDCLVTQNVDELHRKAGSLNLIELHGSAHRVVCLSCDLQMHRNDLQETFLEINSGWSDTAIDEQIAPDGDVLLSSDLVKNFKVPPCPNCGGTLKPDVIFFGDNVPVQVVDRVYELVKSADCLLVAGSSLYVYSGYRFVHRAKTIGKKIVIINIGPTRADDIVDLKIDAKCSDVLSQIPF